MLTATWPRAIESSMFRCAVLLNKARWPGAVTNVGDFLAVMGRSSRSANLVEIFLDGDEKCNVAGGKSSEMFYVRIVE